MSEPGAAGGLPQHSPEAGGRSHCWDTASLGPGCGPLPPAWENDCCTRLWSTGREKTRPKNQLLLPGGDLRPGTEAEGCREAALACTTQGHQEMRDAARSLSCRWRRLWPRGRLMAPSHRHISPEKMVPAECQAEHQAPGKLRDLPFKAEG